MDMVVGQWLLYPWFEEHGVGCVHSDDRSDFKALMPYGKVFRCVGIDEGFLVLTYAGKQFRVTSSIAKPIAAPAFGFGDRVQVQSNGKQRIATIRDILWHFQRQAPYFLLQIEGKTSSRRYWAEELQIVEIEESAPSDDR